MRDFWEGQDVSESTERIVERPRELTDHERLMRLLDANITSCDNSPAAVVAVANKVFDLLSRKQVEWLGFLKTLEYVRLRIEDAGA